MRKIGIKDNKTNLCFLNHFPFFVVLREIIAR